VVVVVVVVVEALAGGAQRGRGRAPHCLERHSMSRRGEDGRRTLSRLESSCDGSIAAPPWSSAVATAARTPPSPARRTGGVVSSAAPTARGPHGPRGQVYPLCDIRTRRNARGDAHFHARSVRGTAPWQVRLVSGRCAIMGPHTTRWDTKGWATRRRPSGLVAGRVGEVTGQADSEVRELTVA
jgi:hypothetical protein